LGYVLFFVIHVVQVTLAGWNNFRSVISGFEVLEMSPPVAVEMAAEETNTSTDQDNIADQVMDDPIHPAENIQ
jgi:hypothetical protein